MKLNKEQIEMCRQGFADSLGYSRIPTLDALCDLALIALDSQGSGWISVDEKLPLENKYGGETDYVEVTDGEDFWKDKMRVRKDGKPPYWWAEHATYTFWRPIGPLPSPPKEPK